MESKTTGKLTPRERLFIESYLVCWNASNAARQAKYAEKQIRQTAHRLMKKPAIQTVIAARLEEIAMGANEALARLAQQARANIADFIQEEIETIEDPKTGETHEFRSMRLRWDKIEERGYLVRAIRSTQYGPAIELHDSQHALELIGKHHKLFAERVELSGSIDVHEKPDLSRLSSDDLLRLEELLNKATHDHTQPG